MKKRLIVGAVAAGVLALGAAGFLAVRNINREKVSVIPVQEIMTSYWNWAENLSGTIVSDVSQDIYLQGSETVKEIYVQEGDEVKEGDKLVSYDMTMVNLEMEMKKLDIEGFNLNIQKAEKELKELKQTKPYTGGGELNPPEGPSEPADPEPPAEVVLAADFLDYESEPYSGEGSEESPYRFLCKKEGIVKGSFLEKMAQQKCFFLIEVRDGDSSAGEILKVWGQKFLENEELTDTNAEYKLKLEKKEEETEPLEPVVYEKLTGADNETPYKGDGSSKAPYTWVVKKDGVVLGSFFKTRKAAEDNFRIEVRYEDQPAGAVVMAWEMSAGELKEKDFSDTAEYYVSLEIKEKTEDAGSEPEKEQAPEGVSSANKSGEYKATKLSGAPKTLFARVIRLADQATVNDAMSGGSQMTAEEIKAAISEKEKQIRDLELSRKEADLELKEIEKKLKNETIYSSFNGVVKKVNDPGSVNGEPLIQVSGSEGLYVQGTVSESMLDDIVPGTLLEGVSYETGVSFTAEVKEVSPYPVGDNYTGSNTSMYPFTAYIESSNGLNNYSYVELTVASKEESSSENEIYINRPFVRVEDGSYYVMIADENNRLKKQNVLVSGMLYGDYYKITSGVTAEDRIAFPYGKNVVEGAMTEDGSLEQLYQ